MRSLTHEITVTGPCRRSSRCSQTGTNSSHSPRPSANGQQAESLMSRQMQRQASGMESMMITHVAEARAVQETSEAAKVNLPRIAQIELGHWITPAGEAVVQLDGELDIASAQVAVGYVRDVVKRHGGPVTVDLSALAFCDASGLGALLRMAGYAERAGCPFRLASPNPSLVKIMRITGLDRRLLPRS